MYTMHIVYITPYPYYVHHTPCTSYTMFTIPYPYHVHHHHTSYHVHHTPYPYHVHHNIFLFPYSFPILFPIPFYVPRRSPHSRATYKNHPAPLHPPAASAPLASSAPPSPPSQSPHAPPQHLHHQPRGHESALAVSAAAAARHLYLPPLWPRLRRSSRASATAAAQLARREADAATLQTSFATSSMTSLTYSSYSSWLCCRRCGFAGGKCRTRCRQRRSRPSRKQQADHPRGQLSPPRGPFRTFPLLTLTLPGRTFRPGKPRRATRDLRDCLARRCTR